MSANTTVDFWQNHINSWYQSQQSLTEYCHWHELREDHFLWWVWRLSTPQNVQPITDKEIYDLLKGNFEVPIDNALAA